MTVIPSKMKALVLTGHGGMDKLEYHEDWPVPTPSTNELLIKVHACGLNNTDVNTRTGWYSKGVTGETTGTAQSDAGENDATWGGAGLTFPRIQGADLVGTVVAKGASASNKHMGKRVMVDTWLRDWSDPLNLDKFGYFGSECDGGYAEYCVVNERQVHAVNSSLSDAELATFVTSYITAENMLNRAAVYEDDTVLVAGASGGVGSALLQLAARRGATVVGLASETKHEQLRQYSNAHLLPRQPENLGDALASLLGSSEVAVVADVVGGDYWSELINVLERGGRYTCAGAIAGPIVQMDLRTFYLRDLTFTGATIVPPDVIRDLLGYIEQGEIKPMLAQTWPLSEFHAAQQAFIDKQHVGNLVVVP